ncbi:MAG: polysaccharide biosynthesis C-terminal domain-containing protein [Lacibacter sp.]
MKLTKALSTSILWRGIYFLSVLLLNVLVARHFEANGSGQIYYITNLFAFVLILISLCLEAPMGYYLSQKKLNETQLAFLSLCWAIAIMIPVYLGIHYFSRLTIAIPFEQRNFEFSASVFLAGNLLITFFVSLFYAKMDYVVPNILLTLVNLFLIVLVPNNETVQNIIGDKEYINFYFFGFFMQGFLLAIFFVIKYVKRKDFLVIPKDIIKPFLNFAFIAVITNSMTFLMYRIDYWFVNKYCTASDLGNYIQACKLAQLFFVIPSILAAVVFPMTASGRQVEVNEKMQMLSRGLILAYSICCAVLLSIGYWLFPLVFGKTFSSMYWPFFFLVPGILSYSVTHLITAYYSGKKVLGVNLRSILIALIIIIIGDIIVIPVFGIKGAAVVSSIGYSCYLSYMMFVHTREYKSKFSDFLLFRKSDWLLLQKAVVQAIYSRKQDQL